MTNDHQLHAIGRGSQINPPNRFLRIHVEDEFEHLEHDELFNENRKINTEYFVDESKSLLSKNDSPDIPFKYSINPYRGCAHGCSYCYARPSHEYLGLSAGLDFETKVFVKEDAPALFRDHLASEAWKVEPVMLSGVTDCYQPAERKFRLTRKILEVALEARQPICIVTKNRLVTRDIDLLEEMASLHLASVAISITTRDQTLGRVMEPRTSTPAARLDAVAELSTAGVPVTVMVSPVVPGLTDSEIPAILKAASEHGARYAGYILLRLPLSVQPVFIEWLERTHPTQRDRVESRIRSTRGGELYKSKFGERMRGTGEIASQINQTFEVFARKYELEKKVPPLNCSLFQRPRSSSGQLHLF